MNCPNCNSPISDDMVFCITCGHKMDNPVPAAPTAETVPVQEAVSAAVPTMTIASENEVPNAPLAEFAPVATAAPVSAAASGSKKKFIIIGAIAGFVVIVAAVLCIMFFGFRADTMHTLLGDKGYVESLIDSSVGTIMNPQTPAMKTAISTALSAVSTSDDEDDEDSDSEGYENFCDAIEEKYEDISISEYQMRNLYQMGTVLKTFSDVGNGKNASVTTGLSIDLNDEILNNSVNSNFSSDDLKQLLKYIGEVKLNGASYITEDSIQLLGAASDNGGNIGGIKLYCGADGNAYVYLDGLTDTVMTIPLPSFDMLGEEQSDDDADNEDVEEVSAMLVDIYGAFKKGLSEGEIEYNADTTSLGAVELDGKVVTIELDCEKLVEMLENIDDVLTNSEVLEDVIGDGLSSMIRSIEDNEDLKLTIEFYVGGDNVIYGAQIKLDFGDNASNRYGFEKLSAAFLSGSNGSAFELKCDKTTIFEFEHEKTSETEGTIEFKLALSAYDYNKGEVVSTPNKLKISYSELGKGTAFDQEVNTANVKISVDSKYCETYYGVDSSVTKLVNGTTMKLAISAKDNSIAYEIDVSNKDYGKISLNTVVAPQTEAIASAAPDNADLVDMLKSNADPSLLNDANTEIMESLIKKYESNTIVSKALGLEEARAELERKKARDNFEKMDFSGSWTTTKIDGKPIAEYCADNGYETWQMAKNVIFTADGATVEDTENNSVCSIERYAYELSLYLNGGSFSNYLYYQPEIEAFKFNAYAYDGYYHEFTIEKGNQSVAMPEGYIDMRNEGDVLNIWTYADEFKTMMMHYPNYVDHGNGTGKIGNVTVKWNIISTTDGYESKLNDALYYQNYGYTSDDEKIDIFITDYDFTKEYVNGNYVLPLSEVGITNSDTAQMYPYTVDVGTDKSGNLKSVAWQACPGAFVYRRSIAKQVLGTDDPDMVQAYISNWDQFEGTAAKMKQYGYAMLSNYDAALRAYAGGRTTPWVDSYNNLQIDNSLYSWADQTKRFLDNGYNKDTTMWSVEWRSDMTSSGNVFGFFMPTWGVDGTMPVYGSSTSGDWAVCCGPQSYFWSGSWVFAASNTDNPILVGDILKKLCCNEAVMEDIARDTSNRTFVNNMSVMDSLKNEMSLGNDFLGGQNYISVFSENAKKIDGSIIEEYDEDSLNKFADAMRYYFKGMNTLAGAIDSFYYDITWYYPQLSWN